MKLTVLSLKSLLIRKSGELSLISAVITSELPSQRVSVGNTLHLGKD